MAQPNQHTMQLALRVGNKNPPSCTSNTIVQGNIMRELVIRITFCVAHILLFGRHYELTQGEFTTPMWALKFLARHEALSCFFFRQQFQSLLHSFEWSALRWSPANPVFQGNNCGRSWSALHGYKSSQCWSFRLRGVPKEFGQWPRHYHKWRIGERSGRSITPQNWNPQSSRLSPWKPYWASASPK